jgi:hypothetical protein
VYSSLFLSNIYFAIFWLLTSMMLLFPLGLSHNCNTMAFMFSYLLQYTSLMGLDMSILGFCVWENISLFLRILMERYCS